MRMKLNVGGQIFETTTETLTTVKSNFFKNLLSNIFKNFDEKGNQIENIFIDRSPKGFEWVLHHLRNPTGKAKIHC